MGQQHYTAFVCGAILTPEQHIALIGPDEDGLLFQWAEHIKRTVIQPTITDERGFWGAAQREMEQEYIPHTAYESRDDWIGFIAAITDDNLADWWGKAGVIRNEAHGVEMIPDMLGKHLATAKQRWKRFAEYCAGQGVVLNSRLLFVADFD